MPLSRVRLTIGVALLVLAGCEPSGPAYAVSVRTASTLAAGPLEIGDTLALVAEARRTAPHAGFAPPVHPFHWRTSDPRVADVTPRGLVVARGPGGATISVDHGGAVGGIAVRVVGP